MDVDDMTSVATFLGGLAGPVVREYSQYEHFKETIINLRSSYVLSITVPLGPAPTLV